MFIWLKNLFLFPEFDDLEQVRIARVLHILTLGLFSGILILIFYNLHKGDNIAATFVIVEIIVLVAFLLNHRGYQKISSIVLSITLILLATFIIVTENEGSHDIVILVFPSVIIVNGLLFNRRYYLSFSFLTIFLFILLLFLEINGIIVNDLSKFSNYLNLIGSVIILLITTVAVSLLVQNLHDTVSKLQSNQKLLLESKSILEGQARILHESEEKFRSIIELAVDALFIFEMDGKIIEINNKATELTGLNNTDLINSNIINLFSEEVLKQKPFRYDLLRMGKNVVSERIITRKDGSSVYIEMSSKLLPNGTVQSFFRDITERKKSEERLRLADEQTIRHQASLLELSKINHSDLDLALNTILETDSQILLVERVSYWALTAEKSAIICEDLYNQSTKTHEKGFILQSTDYPAYFHFIKQNRVLVANDAHSNSATIEFAENYFTPLGITSMLDIPVRRQGELIGVICHEHVGVSRIWTQQEQEYAMSIADMVALVIETIERKQVEESLGESERQFRAFLDSSEDLAFLKDSEGKYLFVNSAMAKALGLNENEIIGKTDFDLIPIKLAVKYKEHDLKALSSEGVTLHEESDGFYSNETRKFKIRLKNNKFGIGGIVRDITKKKNLEKQVIQSEKMAVVGQLAGGIAHDLNNILTVLIGNTELLSKKLSDESKTTTSKYIDNLLEASSRAKNIVLQILSFSKRQQVNKEIFDLNKVVIEMEKMLSRLIPEDIKIVKNICPKSISINADISQVEQIIMNLVINSRDALLGNGVIEIKTSDQEIVSDFITKNGVMKSGRYALLEIKDNGSGIPIDIIDKIFDPFFTTKDIGKGTGLGLSIVLNNINKNDVYINLLSEVEKGTEFKIYFPLIENLDESNQANILSGVPLGNREKILIVEDDDSIRYLLEEYLNDLNYVVLTAKNGVEALQVIEKGSVDAILTDITMPEMGGKELLFNLKQLKIDIPVVAMSGYYQHSEIKIIGFYEILDKPLDMSNVASLFHKIFRQKVK